MAVPRYLFLAGRIAQGNRGSKASRQPTFDAVARFRRPGNADSSKDNLKRDPIYRWFVVFWCFSPLYVLLTPAKPVWLVLAVNSLMVLLIPILALALLRLANDRRRMGPYKNGWLSNAVLVLLVIFSCVLIYKGGLEWWPKLVKLLQP